ncbi:hypothetical protein BJX66DRAFT_345207 [Aspergillus keveii]|uniref:Uncharacterized protein n=1 Tax=Aspergillus keveii TaxID=714993 RepID=A0ABR4FJA8_9EURO
MSFSSLSPEILDLIAGHLASLHKPPPARTTTAHPHPKTSRATRQSPETGNSASSATHSPQPAQTALTYRRRYFQRDEDEYNNLLAFQDGIKALLTELASWSDDASPLGIHLLLSAESPMGRDAGGKKSSPLRGYDDRWAYPGHILSLPHEPSVRSLPAAIPFVRKLTVARTGRHIHPDVLGILIERLPALRELDVKFHAMHRRRKRALLRHRTALARALCAPGLETLETLRIELNEHTPLDHGFEGVRDRDDASPGGDLMNRAVCRLARGNLRELHIEGAWPIPPALFGACEEREEGTGETLAFPNLKVMEVRFPIVTYDGRWLFTGNLKDVEIFDSTDVGPGLDPPTSYEDDMDVELPSDYEDEFEYYDTDVENGDDPMHGWRATPDPEVFNPILEALVKATLAMPQLEHLRAQPVPPRAWGEMRWSLST